MIPLTITPDVGQTPWDDVDPNGHGTLERIGLLRNGTAKGRASVALVIRFPDGTAVIAETTWRLFNAAARALAASPVIAEEDPD